MCVISDRFFDSTTVYQGVARRLDAQWVQQLNQFAVGDCVPDLTLVLDVDVNKARVRILRRVRTVSGDRMEQEPIEFYQAVRAAYRELAKKEPSRVVLIDGDQSMDQIEREIWEVISSRFPNLQSKPKN